MAASWRQLPSWQRTLLRKRERVDPPQICKRGWDGNTNHGECPSMCQVGINVEMSWQVFRYLPSHPSSHKHTVALPGTHGRSAAASGCTDSWQLCFIFASWESWHCHFINYLCLLLGKKASNELFWECSCRLDFHPRVSLENTWVPGRANATHIPTHCWQHGVLHIFLCDAIVHSACETPSVEFIMTLVTTQNGRRWTRNNIFLKEFKSEKAWSGAHDDTRICIFFFFFFQMCGFFTITFCLEEFKSKGSQGLHWKEFVSIFFYNEQNEWVTFQLHNYGFTFIF